MAAHTIPTHAAGVRHRRNRTLGRLAALVLAAAGLFSVSPVAGARSVEISVLDAEHSSRLNVRQGTVVAGEQVVTVTTRTSSSPRPVDDELQVSSRLFAKGHADVFSISAQTSATDSSVPIQSAGAHAETTLRFSTFADGLAPLSFAFTGDGQAYYSSGLVSLVDVTTDESMFMYSWDSSSFFDPSMIPWVSHGTGPHRFTASIAAEPLLLASHVYELTMGASTNAQDDAQRVTIDLSGLQVAPVPEPSTYAMLLMGFGLVGFSTRRCRGPRG